MGCSAQELASASALAMEAFKEADLDHDGNLTFEEFQRWYQNPSSHIASEVADQVQEALDKATLAQLRHLINLSSFSTSEELDKFEPATKGDSHISCKKFEAVHGLRDV